MSASPGQWAESTKLRTDLLRVREAMKGAVSKATTEKRDMSEEEKASFDKLSDEYLSLDKRVEVLEKAWNDEGEEGDEEGEKEIKNEEKEGEEERKRGKGSPPERRSKGKPPGRGGLNNSTVVPHRRESREYRAALGEFLFGGVAGIQKYVEKRNVQMDMDVKGGFMVLPLEMSQNILKKVDDLLPFMQKATTVQVPNAASLGVPTIENNADNGDWTTEIAQINAEGSLSFGKRQLTPTPIRKRILVSERILRMAFNVNYQSDDVAPIPSTGGSVQGLIEDRLAYAIYRTMEIAYMTGSGVGQPLGVFTASTRGISTNRDVLSATAGNIPGVFEWQKLIAGKFSLKVQYHSRAEWFMHRLSMAKIMVIASTTNIPILVNSGIPATPPLLLECPYNLSENVPSAFTANGYVALLGDPKMYWIAISQDVVVKAVDQLYAETGQVGFFVAAEADGMPVLEEAFVRFQLPPS